MPFWTKFWLIVPPIVALTVATLLYFGRLPGGFQWDADGSGDVDPTGPDGAERPR